MIKGNSSIEVSVKSEVIEWAIKTSGWKIEELAKRLNTSETIIEKWIKGGKNPTLRQLTELSLKTKRPLASFLLPKAPPEKPMPKDFRKIQDKKDIFERKTILAIRKARYLQKISYELSINLDRNSKSTIKKIKLSDDSKIIAEKYRELLGLTLEMQSKEFKDSYKLYNYLRDKFEDFNLFCFQISMPIDDARGFVLTDQIPKVVVVNSADNIEPRIFTLLHEFGHVLLGDTSISIPSFNTTDKTEKWCNEFASAFLLPKEIALKLFNDNKDKLLETKTLNYLSRKYKVSKAMLLYNMKSLRFISKEKYDEVLNRPFKKKTKGDKKSGGGVPQDRKCYSELGVNFISLVANNIDKEIITRSDALSYLSIKSRNLNKVLTKARK